VAQSPFAGRVAMEIGDALALPVQDASCDVATISFGIRNVLDVGKGLGEMHRVLRPGGRVLVLECSLPKFAPLRAAYLFYFRRVLPWVGGKVSGSADAYRYLNKTVETFPCGDDFCALMRTAGFEDVSFHPMTFGVATIYVGSKPG